MFFLIPDKLINKIRNNLYTFQFALTLTQTTQLTDQLSSLTVNDMTATDKVTQS